MQALANDNQSIVLPGQYYDQETNLHYNYFRDYDPNIGRYIESDPVGLRGGFNTYGYAIANPIRLADMSGLATWSGIAYQFGAVDIFGVSYTEFDLWSECRCGVKYHIVVHAPALAAGFGVRGSAIISPNVTFDDGESCPVPGAFVGGFLSVSAGVTFGAIPLKSNPIIGFGLPGFGAGASLSKAGDVIQDFGSAGGMIVGKDKSITGSAGLTFVNVLEEESCCQ